VSVVFSAFAAVLRCLAVVAFLAVNLRGNIAFALELRLHETRGAGDRSAWRSRISTVTFQTDHRQPHPDALDHGARRALPLRPGGCWSLLLGGRGFRGALDPQLKFGMEVHPALMAACHAALLLAGAEAPDGPGR
jgi:iron complex transport system permease protein